MFLRTIDEERTLESVLHEARNRSQTWSGKSVDIKVDLTDDEVISLGETQVPATPGGLQALAQFFEIPYKFLERVQPDEQQFILEHRIARSEDRAMVLRHDDHGITEAYLDGLVKVEVSHLIGCLLDVLPGSSPVTDWWVTPDEFRLDVIVPEGFDRGIGGDSKVGDITRGGVRIGQNRKQNLAPWTQTFMFRLACTNGMEVPDMGLRIDARGADEDAILNMFRSETKRAFDRVDHDIEAFYDLRSVKADDDYTGMFRRMARDAGLPDRTVGNMEDTLASAFGEGEPTMFDLVNHITNQANDPDLMHQRNARRRLEQAGGWLIDDHATRCATCHSRLN